jgi:hypothetical protein
MENKVEIHIDYQFLIELPKLLKVDFDLFADVVRSLKKANLIIYSNKKLSKQDLANNPLFALLKQLIDGSKLVIDSLESIETAILDNEKLFQYYFLDGIVLKNKPSNFGKIQIKTSELEKNDFLFNTKSHIANTENFDISNHLNKLKHTHNSIIICDPYFFEKFEQSMKVVSCFINSSNKEYDLSIFATDINNVDRYQEKITTDFRNSNVTIYDCNVNDLHDRFIITNYMYISFSNSIYTYQNLKKQAEISYSGLLSENQNVTFDRIENLKNINYDGFSGNENNRLLN